MSAIRRLQRSIDRSFALGIRAARVKCAVRLPIGRLELGGGGALVMDAKRPCGLYLGHKGQHAP